MKMLPTHHEWRSIPLRYICRLNPAVTFEEFEEDDELTFLPMDRVKNGYFIPNVDKFSKYAPSYNAFEEGDIVLAKVTPCFENGNIAIAESLAGGKGFGSSELFVVRPTKSDRKFLFYYFQSSAFKQEGQASMTGAGGLKRVSPDLLRQHHLPLPNEDTQCAIAAYLDRETARIDALVAAKGKWLELLVEKRRALISHAVTRGLNPNAPMRDSGVPWLGEVPAHWEVTRLKMVAEVRGGLTIGKDYGSEKLIDIPYLRVANVQDGYLDLSTVTTVSVPYSETQRYVLEIGDVLMNEGGDADKLGRGCVWRGEISPCLHQNHVFSVRPHNIDSDWLSLWTSSESAKSYFESNAKQSTNLASISATNLKELPILLPPVMEQHDIVSRVGNDLDNLDKISSRAHYTIALLKERRAALISAAVTGQIDIGEAA
ncbi:MAG: restriction endonuclease subunit S [Magnetococcales bacterium]|nr:restriction endonuclease subunit S [Magnetococcales bacterium]